MQKKLYFAYGSNLSRRQMWIADAGPQPIEDTDGTPLNRCPQSEPCCPFSLHGFRLAFVGDGSQRWGQGGVATVMPASGQVVHGALYRISPQDEARLDKLEGVADGLYYRDEMTIQHQGERVLMYVATAKYGLENMPNRKYLNRILEGYGDWGLPLAELDKLECYAPDESSGN